MKILILGGNGLAGHVLAMYLKNQNHQVVCVARKPLEFCQTILIDIKDFRSIEELIKNGNFDFVIDAIGILTSDAEKNKADAILLNSYLPHFLSEITINSKTRIINLATNCVFSGEKGSYSENDLRDGITFYDRSKGLGELQNSKDITIRTSFIGPDLDENGIGLFNWFMKQENEVNGFNQVYWSGVTTLELAKAIDKLIKSNITGLIHLSNNTRISKYDLMKLFVHSSNHKINVNEYNSKFEDKSLINTREDMEIEVSSYEKMIIEMWEWIENNKEKYPHYFKGDQL